MAKKVKVFQIPLKCGCVSTRFWIGMSFNAACQYGFDMKDGSYEAVYDGEWESDAIGTFGLLDEVAGNVMSCEGYSGREVSVSDIIEIDGDTYYVDDKGYVLIDANRYR